MKVIVPERITSFLSTTVPTDVNLVPSISEYDPNTTYSEQALVTVNDTKKVYESLMDGNLGNYPPSVITDEAIKWLALRSMNQWKPFDAQVGSNPVTQETTIEYVIQPSRIQGLAAMEVYGDSISVIVSHGGAQVFNRSLPLVRSDGFVLDSSIAMLDLPSQYTNPQVTIRVTPSTYDGVARLGEIVVGRVLDIGSTQKSPTITMNDYSKKEVDAFGNVTIVPRAFSKRVSVNVIVETENLNNVLKTLTDLRATPSVWIPTELEDYKSALLIYGYFKDFNFGIPHHLWTTLKLDIEGLT